MISKVINDKEYIFLEVPENTVAWELYDKEDVKLAVLAFVKDAKGRFKPGIPQPIVIPEGKYEIIGKASDLNEEQCGEITPVIYSDKQDAYIGEVYECYDDSDFTCATAKKSLLSLVSSLNLKPETTLIILKQ